MRKIVVGCPTKDRAYIIPDWCEHVIESLELAALDYSFLFAVDKRSQGDIEALTESLRNQTVSFCFVEDKDLLYERDWYNKERYHEMVYLRNSLLKRVRELDPDLFLSVDSDILVDRQLVRNLIEVISKPESNFDAVGGLCYMGNKQTYPSFGFLNPDKTVMFGRNSKPMLEKARQETIEVDVIMAIKLMSRAAYNVDYQYHDKGEDVGWSINAWNAGLRLGWDARVSNSHLMSR